MISRTYVEQLLRNFQTLRKEFLCHACPHFRSKWDSSENFRRQWRSWAEQFVAETGLEKSLLCVKLDEYVLLASEDGNHHEIRVDFLNWVLQHAELS